MPKVVLYDDKVQKVPIKIWSRLETVESAALDQLKNIASLPFVFHHVAVMPDVHLGKGATVGSVIATQGAVCPAAVGVDIGCGMMAVKTNLRPDDLDAILPELRSAIESVVPVGHLGNKTLDGLVTKWPDWKLFESLSVLQDTRDIGTLMSRAKAQLGSLGGGNHFIEVCLDTDQNVWIVLHSGSRNIGKTIAERHIDKAKGLMRQMFIGLPDPDLAYFAEGQAEFCHYIDDLGWCQRYAAKNREVMMARILCAISGVLADIQDRIVVSQTINCHHNYLAREHHFGQNVLVTRKGAVRARVGDFGIIPGSMGTKSYIVRGLGEPESFTSCSHGAGRRMSRGAAKRTFTIQDLAEQTAGIECRKDAGVLDEIPGAYKDIDEVMANQSDLVEIVATLRQILCVKG